MSTWTDWTSCSLTSEQCQKTRSRTCHQGCDDVPNEDLEQTQSCNDVDCPWIRISANDPQLGYQNGIVYPNYEVSLDLKLDDNTISGWSNIFGCSQAHLPNGSYGEYAHGERIPAVFVRQGENKLHVCSSIGDDGNSCWDSEEYAVVEGFNLKIKECFPISSIVSHSVIHGFLDSRACF